MSPCLKVLVFLAPQCGSAHRTVAHRTVAPSRTVARTVALGSWELGSCGAEKLVVVELGGGELRSWEAA